MPAHSIRIQGLQGIPEIRPGMNLAGEILAAMRSSGTIALSETIQAGQADPIVLVVAQKVVSKSEGRLVRLDGVLPLFPG